MTQETKKQRRARLLQKHYDNCAALAALMGKPQDGKKVSLALLKLERIGAKAAEDLCNVPNFDIAPVSQQIHDGMIKIFGQLPPGFFFNRDPRGHALKLEENSVDIPFDKDWGGYQILSPEID